MYSANILLQLNRRKQEDWFVGVNDSAWEHHFDEDNYTLLRNFSLPALNNKPFIKIAKKIPLAEWVNARPFFVTSYNELLEIVND
jgi:hypothetical protein